MIWVDINNNYYYVFTQYLNTYFILFKLYYKNLWQILH